MGPLVAWPAGPRHLQQLQLGLPFPAPRPRRMWKDWHEVAVTGKDWPVSAPAGNTAAPANLGYARWCPERGLPTQPSLGRACRSTPHRLPRALVPGLFLLQSLPQQSMPPSLQLQSLLQERPLPSHPLGPQLLQGGLCKGCAKSGIHFSRRTPRLRPPWGVAWQHLASFKGA